MSQGGKTMAQAQVFRTEPLFRLTTKLCLGPTFVWHAVCMQFGGGAQAVQVGCSDLPDAIFFLHDVTVAASSPRRRVRKGPAAVKQALSLNHFSHATRLLLSR